MFRLDFVSFGQVLYISNNTRFRSKGSGYILCVYVLFCFVTVVFYGKITSDRQHSTAFQTVVHTSIYAVEVIDFTGRYLIVAEILVEQIS